jgi:hypothetical protein
MSTGIGNPPLPQKTMGHWTLGKNRNRIGMAEQGYLTIRPVSIIKPVSIGPILLRRLTCSDHTLSLLSAIATFREQSEFLETSKQGSLAGRPNLLDDSRRMVEWE